MDMARFEPGQSAELVAEITRELTINRTGREGAAVLSTPSLLSLMENACIKASDPYLPADSTTVGFAVDGLRHFAPTAIGEQVRVSEPLLTEEPCRVRAAANCAERRYGRVVRGELPRLVPCGVLGAGHSELEEGLLAANSSRARLESAHFGRPAASPVLAHMQTVRFLIKIGLKRVELGF